MNVAAGCTGKSSFATWLMAHKRAEKMNRRKGQQGHVNVYKCGKCGAYHLGTTDPNERHVNKQRRRRFFEDSTAPGRG